MIRWNSDVSLGELRAYQLESINDQVARLLGSSRAYTAMCTGIDLPLRNYSDFEKLPFLSAQDIINKGTDMVCAPQRQIKRIVSLRTSGTETAKRIYFTSNDIARNVSFFDEGMQPLCGKGDTVLIFMPGTTPDGIAGQLSEGLSRFGAAPIKYGLIMDYQDAAKLCAEYNSHTLVGTPGPMRRLALTAPQLRPKNVLLSADYVSPSVIETIARVWNCEVFLHYGLTESCYGFAVECPGHTGMHIRNDEFYVEIIDPVSGRPLPYGREGIITFTTLKREAMPLIRYKTGDIGIMTDEPCACGARLPRLARVLGRETALSKRPNINALDDLLFAVDSVLDYKAAFGRGVLTIGLHLANKTELLEIEAVLKEQYPDLTLRLEAWNGEAPPGKRKMEYIED